MKLKKNKVKIEKIRFKLYFSCFVTILDKNCHTVQIITDTSFCSPKKSVI